MGFSGGVVIEEEDEDPEHPTSMRVHDVTSPARNIPRETLTVFPIMQDYPTSGRLWSRSFHPSCRLVPIVVHGLELSESGTNAMAKSSP
jgi:hypothetical protein